MQTPEEIAEAELPIIITLARNKGADAALAHFAGVIKGERERAAQACDAIAAESGDHNAVRAAQKCAAAIRALP